MSSATSDDGRGPGGPAGQAAAPPVVVIGAGIGGLAAAAGLRRAGVRPVLVEKKPTLGEIGAGITLWPNALAALDWLGLGDVARRRGAPVADASLRRPDGRWMRRLERRPLEEALGDLPVCLPRPDLIALLREAVEGVELVLGGDCVGYTEHATGVVAHLADGREIAGRALVGADGIHSAVARQMHPGVSLRYAGYTNWRCIAEHPLDDGDVAQTWGRGQHFGCLPLRDGRTYWFATARVPRRSRVPGRELDLVRSRFGHWHHPIPAILAASDPQALLRHDILDRRPLGRWTSARVALVGDAAHPMRPHLAQGGGQAIEDAVVLACAVGALGATAGIAAYERLRRKRAQRVVTESARLGQAIHIRTGLGCRARDTVGAALPTRAVLARMARHGAYRLLADDLRRVASMRGRGGNGQPAPERAVGGHA